MALVAIALMGISASASGDAARRKDPTTFETGPIRTSNRTLQGSLERIASRSALWREALDTVRHSGRHIRLLTPDQVVIAAGSDGKRQAFDRGLLAEVAPVLGGDSRVGVVLVVVNLPLLQANHASDRSLFWEFEADLDRILVHEVYGHALPYLLAGDLSGRCPDPQPDERVSEACSIRRENAVRAELGLGRRTDSGVESLALVRNRTR